MRFSIVVGNIYIYKNIFDDCSISTTYLLTESETRCIIYMVCSAFKLDCKYLNELL